MLSILPTLRLRRFVAVDFDSRQLRLVQAERSGGKTRILKLASVPMPDGLDPSDAQKLGAFLKRTLKQLKLGSAPVVMHLPRGQAVLKPMSLPPGTQRDEMAGMVRYQVENDLPFAGEEAVIDFTVTSSHYDAEDATAETAGENVLVAAARLPAVDHYRQIAEAAGVKLLRLGLRPYANLTCVEACTIRGADEAVALVQLTADETEIDVIAGSSLAFSRSAPSKAGDHPHPDSDEGQRAVSTVVTEVIRSLQSYAAVERGHSVDAILVAGSTGIEPRVCEILHERLGIQAELLDPAGGFRIRSGENTSGFVSALGLAAGSHGDEQPFDFLSPKQPVVKTDHRRTYLLAGVAGVVLLIGAIVPLREAYLSPKQSRRADLYRQRSELRKQVRQAKALPQRYMEVRDFLDDQYNWPLHLSVLSVLLPSADNAYLPSGLRADADGSVTFAIRTRDVGTIQEVTEKLDAADFTYKLGRSGVTESDPYGYTLSYEMTVYLPEETKAALAKAAAVDRPADDVAADLLTSPEGYRRWRERARRSRR